MNKSLSIITLLILTLFVSTLNQNLDTPTQSWNGMPNGWGISDSDTNFKSITNMNAPNWILGNQTIDDYNKQLFNFITNNNVTKCPLSTPFFEPVKSKCIQCSQPTPIFDLFKKQCVACPAGLAFNPSTHQCENSKCKANYIWSINKCVCPETAPIDLGCQCVKCLQPFAWKSAQKACKLRCQQTHVWNSVTQKCECPQSTPYQFNGQCISCNAPFEWQTASNSCQLKANTCGVPSISTPTPATPTVQSCASNFIWDNVVQKCVCPYPSYIPFNDGTKCMQCNLPQYWDHDLKQCLSCPSDQYFNTISRKCESCPTNLPLLRNNACEACSAGTTYKKETNTCQEDTIDPTATAKIPVATSTSTVAVPSSGEEAIQPQTTNTVPIYSTTSR